MTPETWQYVLLLEGREVQLNDGEVTLGRSRTSTVRVEHESVSRSHALLTLEQGAVTLKDLNSSNGTFVSGKRVQGEARVNDGDRIQLGAAVVTLKIVAPFKPAEKTALFDTGLGHKAAPAEPAAPPQIPLHPPAPTVEPPVPEGPSAISAPPASLPVSEPPREAHPLEISADELLRRVEERASLDAAIGTYDTVSDSPQPEPFQPKAPVPVATLDVGMPPMGKASPAAPPKPAPSSAPSRPYPPLPEVVESPSLPPKIRIVRPSEPVPEHSLSQVPLRRSSRPRSTNGEMQRFLEDAGFGLRFVAFLVDGVILSAMNLLFLTPVALVYFFVGQVSGEGPRPGWILITVSILSFLLIFGADFWYIVGGWAKSGRTPGKALMGLKIVAESGTGGAGLGFQIGLTRWVFMILGAIPLYAGWLAAAFRKDGKAWHDVMAGTRVVKSNSRGT